MKRCCLIVVVVAFAFSAHANDTLRWSKHNRLSFDDFKGIPPDSIYIDGEYHHVLGLIHRSISVYIDDSSSDRIIFTVVAEMNRSTSWIRHDNDSGTLKHE